MFKKHEFETIITSNDVINIQDGIGKGIGFREKSYSMGINAYFGPIQTHRSHATSNYGP